MKLDKALRREAHQRKARQGMRVSNRSLKTVQAALAERTREWNRLAGEQHFEWHRLTGKQCFRPGCPHRGLLEHR